MSPEYCTRMCRRVFGGIESHEQSSIERSRRKRKFKESRCTIYVAGDFNAQGLHRAKWIDTGFPFVRGVTVHGPAHGRHQ